MAIFKKTILLTGTSSNFYFKTLLQHISFLKENLKISNSKGPKRKKLHEFTTYVCYQTNIYYDQESRKFNIEIESRVRGIKLILIRKIKLGVLRVSLGWAHMIKLDYLQKMLILVDIEKAFDRT